MATAPIQLRRVLSCLRPQPPWPRHPFGCVVFFRALQTSKPIATAPIVLRRVRSCLTDLKPHSQGTYYVASSSFVHYRTRKTHSQGTYRVTKLRTCTVLAFSAVRQTCLQPQAQRPLVSRKVRALLRALHCTAGAPFATTPHNTICIAAQHSGR